MHFCFISCQKLESKHHLLCCTPQGLFLSWHGWPLPSSFPWQHGIPRMRGWETAPCVQAGQAGCVSTLVPMGEPAPLLSSQHRGLAVSSFYPPYNESGKWWQAQGLPRWQPKWHSKRWANWERASCILLSLHWSCSWWPAAWTCGFLNGNSWFMICFSPTSENLAEMRFWAFTSLSVLVCNVLIKLGRKTHMAIFSKIFLQILSKS